MDQQPYDAGHLSFLEIIKVLYQTAGPSFAKGALVKTGVSAAQSTKEVAFATMEDFLASVETLNNPIAQFEGRAVHFGDGIFGLPTCPFACSIRTYAAVKGALPREYREVTEEMNKPSAITDKLRVGQGAAVSPFCAVHQPIRSALGERITVGGRPLHVYQLGCKSGAGVKGLARPLIDATGADPARVDKILDDHMCCYLVRFEGANPPAPEPTAAAR